MMLVQTVAVYGLFRLFGGEFDIEFGVESVAQLSQRCEDLDER